MNTIDRLFDIARRISPSFLRISLGIVLLWIGALKFWDPSPVVGLLQGSLSFLASPIFVYVLGVLEVATAVLLFANVYPRYVGVLPIVLFLGTLTIFVIAPGVTYGEAGFPFLSLVGEFLLKDLVLLASAVTIIATDSARVRMPMEEPMMTPAMPQAAQAH